MNNGELNWKEGKIFHSAATEVFTLKDLANDQDLMKKVDKIGESKGTYVNFKKDDIVTFPSEEDAEIYLDGFVIYNGEKRLALSCKAHNERLGFFACPMALFRRTPLMEKLQGQDVAEYDQFTTGNDFGEQLLIAKNDLARVKMMLGGEIRITDRMICHQYSFVMDEVTKKPRQDTSKLKPLICYKTKRI